MLTAQKTEERSPTAYEALTAPLDSHFNDLDAFFASQVDTFEPEIKELVVDSIRTPGKLLRPILVFYAGWTSLSTPHKDLTKAAAVIELVHQATLVHDDILDS